MAQKTVIARVEAKGDILSATITVPSGTVNLTGPSSTDKSAKVNTDNSGFLLFRFALEAPFPGIQWRFTLTEDVNGAAPKHEKISLTDAAGKGEDVDDIIF